MSVGHNFDVGSRALKLAEVARTQLKKGASVISSRAKNLPGEQKAMGVSAMRNWKAMGKKALIYIYGAFIHGVSGAIFGYFRSIREPGVLAPSTAKALARSERSLAKAEARVAKMKAKAEAAQAKSLAKAKSKSVGKAIAGPPPKAGTKPRCTVSGYAEKAGPAEIPQHLLERLHAAQRMMDPEVQAMWLANNMPNPADVRKAGPAVWTQDVRAAYLQSAGNAKQNDGSDAQAQYFQYMQMVQEAMNQNGSSSANQTAEFFAISDYQNVCPTCGLEMTSDGEGLSWCDCGWDSWSNATEAEEQDGF